MTGASLSSLSHTGALEEAVERGFLTMVITIKGEAIGVHGHIKWSYSASSLEWLIWGQQAAQSTCSSVLQEIFNVQSQAAALQRYHHLPSRVFAGTVTSCMYHHPNTTAGHILAKHKDSLKGPLKKQEVDSAPQLPKVDLLTVPAVDTQMEARPMTLEEMEEVGKRYCEQHQQRKLTIPSIQYTEQCRMVRCRNQHFDEHCLPSTIHGDMRELIDSACRHNFLVYLRCWKLCESYGIPLTEDILIKDDNSAMSAFQTYELVNDLTFTGTWSILWLGLGPNPSLTTVLAAVYWHILENSPKDIREINSNKEKTAAKQI
ncbi:hypothetical protein P7K49_030651 [Saguinus oedipus]|uniref:Uncharacterized protein n=1 Tax=Saguinus oedipus TaxID=9490 RepID=A0ABQ9U2R7_SAGOE|nr:hypothetical protein P7K49_030651 [Saguinus oedipus]